ncbi:MAG: TlpA family protein disulfide reductase [Bacteroidetes bacterium]|nr:MAG: TlpA family protein disulfide reductase [Bacteroidota bacterium]
MKKIIKSILLFAIMLTAFAGTAQEVRTLLTGELINLPYQTLALMKATENFDHGERVIINLVDGKFEHKLVADVLEVYVLFFEEQLARGSLQTFYFVPDSERIYFSLYPSEDFEKTEIRGSEATNEINAMYNKYREKFQPLFEPIFEIQGRLIESGEFFSEQYKKYQDAYQKAMEEENYEKAVYYTSRRVQLMESGDYVSEKGRVIVDEIDSVSALQMQWELDYLAESLSLYSYLRLIQLTQGIDHHKSLTIENLNNLAEKFYNKYPDHPYTRLSKSMLEALKRIQVGNKFIDFSLPDLKGNMHQLSEVIEGKYAVIDLWASWCGPCIMGSRELIPVYEEFKDKGFTIFGVAREFRNTDEMVRRIEMEGFSWLNLVELDDRNNIWLQYGVAGGGRKLLVDDKGIILAIDPQPQVLREILMERLSEKRE